MSEVVRLGTVGVATNGVAPRENYQREEGKYKISGIGVVGLGYWGPNWVRNLHQLRQARRVVACDLDAKRRDHVSGLYAGVEGSSSLDELLRDSEIEGLVIATPVSTHFPLAKKALMAGKSVLVEKPLAMSSAQAAELVRIARDNGRVLMVGHTFEYSAPVLKMRDIIESGELGDMFYLSSIRANLGLIQHDVNVAWDLATHDISIILMLMGGQMPEAVSCQGQSHYKNGNRGRGDALAALPAQRHRVHPRELARPQQDSPHHHRRVASKMLVYDDMALQEKIRIYDKGVDVAPYYDTFGEFQFSYRYGNIHDPAHR